MFILPQFFLTTWDLPGKSTDLSCLEFKCDYVWGGASEFWAGWTLQYGAIEKEGPLKRKAHEVVIFLLTGVAVP